MAEPLQKFNLFRTIREVVREIVKREYPSMQIYQVTDVSSLDSSGNVTEFKINIKHMNHPIQYNDVPMMGIGLGNLKGYITYPKPGDFVVVGFFDREPIVLGTINDVFSQTPDNIPQIGIDETIIVNKERGQYMFMNSAGDVIIQTPDGARLKLTNSGTLKLLDGDGYGVIVEGNDVKIYSNTVETADKGAGSVNVPLTYNSSTTF